MMPELRPQNDLAALAEQAVINGLRNPDRIVRLHNALQIPKDTQVGPRVRPELVQMAASDPDEEVREAASFALTLLAGADDGVDTVLRAAWTAPDPSRIERVLDWLRDRLIPMVPEPAADGSAPTWPFFRHAERGRPGPVAGIHSDGDDVSIIVRQLPSALEGRRIELLVPSLREAGDAAAGWLRSEQTVDAGTVVVRAPRAVADARALGPIWIAAEGSASTLPPRDERESPLRHLDELVRERIGGTLTATFHVRPISVAAAQSGSTVPIDAGIDLQFKPTGLDIVIHGAFVGPRETAHVIAYDATSGLVIHEAPPGSGAHVVHLAGVTVADLHVRRIEVVVALVERR